MKDISLKLNEREANELLSILDLAIKAGGLQVARVVLNLQTKLQEAHDSANAESPSCP